MPSYETRGPARPNVAGAEIPEDEVPRTPETPNAHAVDAGSLDPARLLDNDRRCLAAVHDDLQVVLADPGATRGEVVDRVRLIRDVLRAHLQVVGVVGSEGN